MSTETVPPEDDDQATHGDGLGALCRRYFRRPYLVVALAAYVVLALLGVYASLKIWSSFDLDYLSYAGFGDYLLAPVTFLGLLIDPSFVAVLAVFAVILALVAGCGGYLLMRLRTHLRDTRRAQNGASKGDVLPLVELWEDRETLLSYLRALPTRPLWLAPVIALAAVLAINIDAATEKRDLRSFARLIQHDYLNKDKYQKLGRPYSRYELVSLPTSTPPGRRDHLVRLRSTDGFAFYYDVLDDQPLVVAANVAAGEVADADLVDSAPLASADSALPVGLATAGGSPQLAAPDGMVPTASRVGTDGAQSGVTDLTLRGSPNLASVPALPSGRTAGSSQIAPAAMAGERAAAGAGSNLDVVRAIDTTAVANAPSDGAGSLPAPRETAPPPGASKLVQQPVAAPGTATPKAELEAIGTNLRKSEGSLEGLKSYTEQMAGSIGEIRKFIDELDGSLKQIDQAFGQLSDLQAAVEQVAYADCSEMTAGQPLEFAANDATLSLEAVGWLFQARRELAAQRSAERKEWLVIEGHGDTGQPAADPPLSIRRAAAVRDFMQSDLGVSPDVVKVVSKGVTGPDADVVNLYDCLGRRPAAASAPAAAPPAAVPRAAAATADLGLIQSASAGEASGNSADDPSASESVRPAAWEAGDGSGGLPAMLADLDPRPQARGLLVTVPGDRLFDTDSYRIRTDAYGLLGRIGEALVRAPERNALIVGHSDAIGEAAYNRDLSVRRARAVRDFLVDRFKIAADRLTTEGRGEDDPIATNDTPAGRLANRRIEVLLLN